MLSDYRKDTADTDKSLSYVDREELGRTTSRRPAQFIDLVAAPSSSERMALVHAISIRGWR